MTMLNVYGLDRKKTAVLQDAFDIIETHELNQIYELSFSLPATDEKTQFCKPRHYVRWGEDGELYRIKAQKVSESDTSVFTYECEHAITTLIDNVMFGSFQYGGASIRTSAVINWLLNKQTVKNWRLGECDFNRNFEYLWEQENLLNALYSIPKEFVQPYKWVFDTTHYPWTISLKAIDTSLNPEYYLRARSNILSAGKDIDYTNICTRIYPLGYGEGVNQLNIKGVNNGVPYLQSPQSYIDKYGIIEKVLVDRQFYIAGTLKAYAQTLLDLYQEPTMSRSFSVTDLYQLTSQSWDNAEVGKICKMTQDGSIAYITKIQKQHDKAGDLKIDLSTKATDIASTVADLADRVRIESVYAQGATQLYQHSKDANATPEKGMVLSLYFPSEMKQINKVLLRMTIGKFRSYSQTTSTNDVTLKTNSKALTGLKTTYDGGGTTSSSGGTSVTVGGGSVSGQSTLSESVSVDVSATGVSYAPQTTTTSEPSVDVTSETTWSRNYSTVTTEPAPNGAVVVNLGDGSSKIYGGTYALNSANDGYHSHSTQYISSGIIDGGTHHHNVSVDIPIKSFNVNVNDPSFSSGGSNHIHYIVLNALAHNHKINHYHTVRVSGSGSGGNHSHTFSIPNHTHTISAHSHKLPDLSHTHDIVLNGHSHTINAGIFESGSPSAFDIYVRGTKKATVNSTSYDGDITQWLLNNENQIPRDSWIDIEIRPNDLAYVVSSVFVQGFVQSRGGGNY